MLGDCTTRSASSSAGVKARPSRVSAAAASAATACGATVRAGAPCIRASSSRLPPQRTRVTAPDRPASARCSWPQTAGRVMPPRARAPRCRVGAGGDDRRGGECAAARRAPGGAPARSAEKASSSATCSVSTRPTDGSVAEQSASHGSPSSRAKASACCVSVARLLDEDQNASCDPDPLHHLDDRGRRLGALAEDLGLLALPAGTTRRSFSSRGSGASASSLDRLPLRAQLRRHRRVARQVEALEHRDHGGQRQVVDVAAAGRPPARSARVAPSTATPFRPVATGRPSACATRMPTWKPPESADSLPKKIRSKAVPPRPPGSRRRSPPRSPAGPTPRRRSRAGSRGRRRSPARRGSAPRPRAGRA